MRKGRCFIPAGNCLPCAWGSSPAQPQHCFWAGWGRPRVRTQAHLTRAPDAPGWSPDPVAPSVLYPPHARWCLDDPPGAQDPLRKVWVASAGAARLGWCPGGARWEGTVVSGKEKGVPPRQRPCVTPRAAHQGPLWPGLAGHWRPVRCVCSFAWAKNSKRDACLGGGGTSLPPAHLQALVFAVAPHLSTGVLLAT